ncbi:MAG: hypothetical protein CL845_07740 [Crocinitomicaceae bacterium]|nr:hypothetical protein [Crocinitomicaceae bacterium]
MGIVTCAGPLSIEGQQVLMMLDTSAIAIGEPTVLRIQADRDITAGSGTFLWPEWQDTIPGGLEILKVLGADTAAVENEIGNNIIRIERTYEITAWDSGYLAVPPVVLVWGADTLTSNPLLLNVLLAPPGEPGQIAGHADIRRVQWTWKERLQRWIPWLLICTAALGLAIFLIRKWRNRPRLEAEQASSAKIVEPAHIVALRELERIEKEAAWKKGQVKIHHGAVSQVLRIYFERRFNYPAMERSTDELRKGLVNLPIRAKEKELILELLSITDLVKFAKWNPQEADHQRVVKQGIRFVEVTTVVPENNEE